ncbi:MAG: LysR family transcriptional regulator [Alphaproteobacteria bacterium]|nr:LysR family transcriptional regulator [Alphaproteobacteria bacterium]
MNLRDMEYVVAVAEEKHFGRAADRCHVSQPALSGQIQKLEDFLGVALFERTNRSVSITPVGEKIVAQAQQLITMADEIVLTAQAAKDPLSGPFRLGMIATIAPSLSPLILAKIRDDLPNLSLTLVEGFTADLEKAVAVGDLDGAILATAPEEQRLTEKLLYDEPFWIALPKGHTLCTNQSIDVCDLPHEELLLLADGHCLRNQVLDVCSANTGTANSNTRETSLGTLLALVAAGDGITLVPALSKPTNTPNIVTLKEASGTAGRIVRLAYRASFPRTAIIEGLSDIVRQSVPKKLVRIIEP